MKGFLRSNMHPSLPPELAPIILCQAPDAPTLRNLILCAPSFYHGHRATSKVILEAVLNNEYGSHLLPEALATQLSSRLPRKGLIALGTTFSHFYRTNLRYLSTGHLLIP